MLSNRHAINEVVYDGTRQWWVRWQLYRAPLQPDSRGTVCWGEGEGWCRLLMMAMIKIGSDNPLPGYYCITAGWPRT